MCYLWRWFNGSLVIVYVGQMIYRYSDMSSKCMRPNYFSEKAENKISRQMNLE